MLPQGPNIFSKLSGERFIRITCINRKRCRRPMREDIIRGFWNVYEEEAWILRRCTRAWTNKYCEVPLGHPEILSSDNQ